ncbi:LOW QUALITY PROTEIN: hypothetical protein TorRG33x02_198920 [Trema orientale]|uniref:Uncharacterized protein n=1 Tax=Trema orientale TaxID=63057 RepID=A0A2P5EFJ9_TREOI|nr:LOW QUALITY PROTEIN: hypothetical protein TorRG33x02_198920 [Trema orientale]
MVSPPKRTSGSKNGTFCNGSARLAHTDIKLMQDCVLTMACEMLTPRLNPPQANLVSWTSITGISEGDYSLHLGRGDHDTHGNWQSHRVWIWTRLR